MDEQLDDVAEEGEALAVRDAEDARKDPRHRDDGTAKFAGRRVAEQSQQVESFVRQDGEGVRRVDRERGQRRQDVTVEAGRKFRARRLSQLFAGEHVDAVRGEGWQEFLLPAGLLGVDQGAGALQDFGEELLGRGMAGGFLLLHDAGDADLEELVEVRADDGQEADAFEERDGFVFGEFEDSTVETKPAEFAIEHGDDGSLRFVLL